MTAGPDTRDGVDQLDSCYPELGEVVFEIVRSVGNVMKRRPTSVEETPDAGFGVQGLEKLDEADERHAHPLGLEGLGLGTALAREEFVEAACLVYGVDGNRHVVDRAVRYRNMGHRRMLHSAPNGDKERCNGNE